MLRHLSCAHSEQQSTPIETPLETNRQVSSMQAVSPVAVKACREILRSEYFDQPRSGLLELPEPQDGA